MSERTHVPRTIFVWALMRPPKVIVNVKYAKPLITRKCFLLFCVAFLVADRLW